MLASCANSLRALPAQLAGKSGAVRSMRMFGPRAGGGRRSVMGVVVTVEDFDRMMQREWKAV